MEDPRASSQNQPADLHRAVHLHWDLISPVSYTHLDERCDSVDRAAEPSALALSQICGLLTHDGGQRRVLERFEMCIRDRY